MQSIIKPFLFGYLRVRIIAGPDTAEAGRQLLRRFADVEGFALVDVFVDANENEPFAALAALIQCVRTCDADHRGIAIAVPDLNHLGADLPTQRRMRDWIQHRAQVRLIVARG